ncbi:MAG TPA: amidase family protein [Acidimicrobiia bacterium]|jgi:aspartyl-tRNA(Asn)/glutamyl-tRNA(Gln) amidotransferase subunit A
MSEIWERDAYELADDIRGGRLRSREVVDHFLVRIERFDPVLNAMCDLDADGARSQADAIDERVAAGEDPGPLAGVPIGVKELAAVRGLSHTHGSLLYAGEKADHDCTEVARLRDAGAVIVGKTAAPEFGSTNWTQTHVHGVTGSAWNPERTPGGSSGGSAAAVASGMLPICTGSDGGGSIRIPSSYSGLFGAKISFGLSGSGPEAFDNSLTTVPGPVCRSVRDAARYIDVIAGPTNSDPTSLAKPSSFEAALFGGSDARARLRGRRVAWSSTLGHAVCDPEVERVAHAAARQLCDGAGFEMIDVDVAIPNPARAWSIISNLAVAADHLERARGRFDELTPVARAGMAYTEHLAADDILRALRRRDELLAAIGRVFDEVDFLLTPTTATTAFAAAGPPPTVIAGKDVGGMGNVPFTAPFNISGQAAVSIPAGLSGEGLPIGVQVVGRRHDELGVLACGLVMEQSHPWPKFAPLASS